MGKPKTPKPKRTEATLVRWHTEELHLARKNAARAKRPLAVFIREKALTS